MSGVAIQQMADRVAALMEERMGIRGADLAAKVRKAGRSLPRKIRAAATDLADAAERSQNPKLLVQIDQAKVAADYDLCVRHLMTVRRGGVIAGLLTNVAGTLLVGLMLLGAVIFLVQRMRGQM